MRTVRVPRKPVVLIAMNSHEMPTMRAGLDQISPRPSLAGHLLTRTGGAGERFGPDYIWVSWIDGKDLAPGALTSGPWPVDADALHRCLLDHSPCAGPVSRRPAVVKAGFFEGQYEPAPLSGVTRRCTCRCNLPQPAGVRHCRRARPRRTMVPPGCAAVRG